MTSNAAKNPSILLVDDSTTDRVRSVGLLRKADEKWNVVDASGGKEALDQLQQNDFDVVITDLVMPDIDGRQLLKKMQQLHPHIPVILITAQGDDRIAAECLSMGATTYVPKRSLAQDLPKGVKELLQQKQEADLTAVVLKHVKQSRCNFTIDSDLYQIRSLVNFVRQRLQASDRIQPAVAGNITSAVREALLNAHFHGNLETNRRPLELSRYEYRVIAEERREQPEYQNRRIRFEMNFNGDLLAFTVSDDGSGFDPSQLPPLTEVPDESFPNGNGLRSMNAWMDTVKYNDSGNEVNLQVAIASV